MTPKRSRSGGCRSVVREPTKYASLDGRYTKPEASQKWRPSVMACERNTRGPFRFWKRYGRACLNGGAEKASAGAPLSRDESPHLWHPGDPNGLRGAGPVDSEVPVDVPAVLPAFGGVRTLVGRTGGIQG